MKNRATTAVVFYSVIQLMLLIVYFSKTFIADLAFFTPITDYQFNFFLGILIILLNAMGIYMTRKVLVSTKLENEYEIQKINLDNIIRLNNSQRSQRHDFSNHLHVIYNLIEIERFDKVKDYIKKLYMDVQETAITVGSGLLEIDALIQSKMSYSKGKGVKLNIEVLSAITNIAIEPWQLVRVLGNIIDNAIDACQESTRDEKIVTIIFSKTQLSHIINIKNTGIPIKEENLKKIFEEGFSTKGKSHGLGLYISKNIIRTVEGSIKVISNAAETRFEIDIPINEKEQPR